MIINGFEKIASITGKDFSARIEWNVKGWYAFAEILIGKSISTSRFTSTSLLRRAALAESFSWIRLKAGRLVHARTSKRRREVLRLIGMWAEGAWQ